MIYFLLDLIRNFDSLIYKNYISQMKFIPITSSLLRADVSVFVLIDSSAFKFKRSPGILNFIAETHAYYTKAVPAGCDGI